MIRTVRHYSWTIADVAVSVQPQITHRILGFLCLTISLHIFHHRTPPEPVTSVLGERTASCQMPEQNSMSDG